MLYQHKFTNKKFAQRIYIFFLLPIFNLKSETSEQQHLRTVDKSEGRRFLSHPSLSRTSFEKHLMESTKFYLLHIFLLIFVLSHRCMLLNAFFIPYLSDNADKKPFSSLAHIKGCWTTFNALYFLNLTHHDIACYMVSCYDNQIARMMRSSPLFPH
jgi:hypothetical protein